MKTITHRRDLFQTPWFSLVEKEVEESGEKQLYYSISTADYACVVPVTDHGDVVLVWQYRPAVEREVLELPSGHVDPGDTPSGAAARELLEETGYRAENLELVGCLDPDVGRLSNRQWCFRARAIPTERPPEAGVRVELVPRDQMRSRITNGEFRHAQHVAAVLLAFALDAL